MSQPQKFSKFFSAALLFHVLVLIGLATSFEWNSTLFVTENSDKDRKIINAVVLNALPGTQVPPKKAEMPPLQPTLEPKPLPPSPKPEPKPVDVKKAIAISEQRKKQQQMLIEKQLLADMKKAVEKQKKLKHKVLAQAFEKELKEQTEKNLQKQLLQETNPLAHAQSQQVRGEVDKYKALILQAISQRWLVPPTVNKKLSCEVLIRLAPGGLVLDAQIVKSSGDLSLDRSARAAVFKASPLPVPRDFTAFQPFKAFILKVKPENITSADSELHG
jgi:colicin import membrane protein